MSRIILFLTVFIASANVLSGQELIPSLLPSVTYVSINNKGEREETTTDDFKGNAPAEATLSANPVNDEGWSSSYQWTITRTTDRKVILDRYLNDEDETTFTFEETGSYNIVCIATFVNGNDTIKYDEEYWAEVQKAMRCEIYDSKLVMPNAFSPNGDGSNDTYKPKEYQSIVEFHATIYNRWGQKLYQWDNVADEGWDGSFNGNQVKDGVYYCLVRARGADGQTFTIRKDVNILRGFSSNTETSN